MLVRVVGKCIEAGIAYLICGEEIQKDSLSLSPQFSSLSPQSWLTSENADTCLRMALHDVLSARASHDVDDILAVTATEAFLTYSIELFAPMPCIPQIRWSPYTATRHAGVSSVVLN